MPHLPTDVPNAGPRPHADRNRTGSALGTFGVVSLDTSSGVAAGHRGSNPTRPTTLHCARRGALHLGYRMNAVGIGGGSLSQHCEVVSEHTPARW
jgi:hypothetical protein